MVLGLVAAGVGLGALGKAGAGSFAKSMIGGAGKMAASGYRSAAARYPRATRMATRTGMIVGGGVALNMASEPYAQFQKERFMSRYGDTEETQQIWAQRERARMMMAVGIPTALVGGGIAGAAAFRGAKSAALGAGRYARSYIPKRVRDTAAVGMPGAYNYVSQRRLGIPSAQSVISAGKAIGRIAIAPAQMLAGGPARASLIAGAAAGAGAGMASQAYKPRNNIAPEGIIQGIQSAPRGGINPSLQFSTQGLTLGIHNRRQRRIV